MNDEVKPLDLNKLFNKTMEPYHSPYCLTVWGGREIGKRPRTKMAYIRKVILKPNEPAKYIGSVIDNTTGEPKKTQRTFLPGEIICEWDRMPSKSIIKNLKERLTPVDQFGVFQIEREI